MLLPIPMARNGIIVLTQNVAKTSAAATYPRYLPYSFFLPECERAWLGAKLHGDDIWPQGQTRQRLAGSLARGARAENIAYRGLPGHHHGAQTGRFLVTAQNGRWNPRA